MQRYKEKERDTEEKVMQEQHLVSLKMKMRRNCQGYVIVQEKSSGGKGLEWCSKLNKEMMGRERQIWYR